MYLGILEKDNRSTRLSVNSNFQRSSSYYKFYTLKIMTDFENLQKTLEDYFNGQIDIEWKQVHELLRQIKQSSSSNLSAEEVKIYNIISDPPKYPVTLHESEIYKHSKLYEETCLLMCELQSVKQHIKKAIENLEANHSKEVNRIKIGTDFFDTFYSLGFGESHEDQNEKLVRLFLEYFFDTKPAKEIYIEKKLFPAKIKGEKEYIFKEFKKLSSIYKKTKDENNSYGYFSLVRIANLLTYAFGIGDAITDTQCFKIMNLFENHIDRIVLLSRKKEILRNKLSDLESSPRLTQIRTEYQKEVDSYYRDFKYLSPAENCIRNRCASKLEDYTERLEIVEKLSGRFEILKKQGGNALRKQGNSKLNIGKLKVNYIDWKLLEEYDHVSAKKSKELLLDYCKSIFKNKLDEQRIEKIYELQPSESYVGRNELRGYICFLFKDVEIAVLEKPIYGNATYLLPENNWKELSRLTRTTLLREYPEVKRCIHYDFDSWIASVKQYLAAVNRP